MSWAALQGCLLKSIHNNLFEPKQFGTVAGLAGVVAGLAGVVAGLAEVVADLAGVVAGLAGVVADLAGLAAGLAGVIAGLAGMAAGLAEVDLHNQYKVRNHHAEKIHKQKTKKSNLKRKLHISYNFYRKIFVEN